MAENILLQVGLGLLMFLGFFLDYKWTDKRTKEHKNGLTALWIVASLVLVGSICSSITQEKDHNAEVLDLNGRLDSLQASSDRTEEMLTPITAMAKELFPDLPTIQAIEKLKEQYSTLSAETGELSVYKARNEASAIKQAKLKRTPPHVWFDLEIKNDKLYVVTNFRNAVPIEIKPYLMGIENEKGEGIKQGGWTVRSEHSKVHPSEGKGSKHYFEYEDLRRVGLTNISEALIFKMIIRYRSVYYSETTDERLVQKLTIKRKYDPTTGKFSLVP